MALAELWKSVLKTSRYIIIGTIYWIITICLYIPLSIPVYIHRFLVINVVALYFFPKIGRPLNLDGQGCGTDFTRRHLAASYRNGVVIHNAFVGTISPNEMLDTFQRQCLDRRDDRGDIMFPELKQYIGPFLGFMFWKDDEHFKLKNHMFHHDLGNTSTDSSSERFMHWLLETLMNKRFSRKRSPWEIHLVNNYRNSSTCNDVMSVVVLRIHHSVVDGISALNLLGAMAIKPKIENMNWLVCHTKESPIKHTSSISHAIPNPCRMIYDTGYLFSLFLHRSQTPWLVPDYKKSGHLHSMKSKVISVNDVKRIKNKLGVGFNTVILSCISAGISNFLKPLRESDSMELATIPVVLPLPRWNSSTKLGVSMTAVVIDLPIEYDMDPKTRVLTCQEIMNSAKRSTMPAVFTIFSSLVQSNLTSVTREIARNQFCPIFVTIFPLPQEDCYFNGKNKMVEFDYCCGGMLGDAGLGISVLSFEDKLKIVVTAESAIMNREQLAHMTSIITNEFEILSSCINESNM